jgi:serine protease Do
MKGFRKTAAVFAIGGASVAAWVVGSNLVKDAQFARAKEDVNVTREQLSTVQDLSTVFRKVGKSVEPSVVNIVVHKGMPKGRRALPFNDDLLKKFFPDRDGDGQPDLPEGFGDGAGPDDSPMDQVVGTGSGVIMETQGGSGFILTNNHVAGGATDLEVTLADGRVIKGKDVKVLGADAKTDLAVVKVEADHLITAKWGDSDQLERGDWVLAFGSPFGYTGSMTHGIVSALNRQAGILSEKQGYENFIQVDAPINPGNSGGPLTNIHGEVVGINTAIASRSGSFSGLGFAIPSNQAKFVYSSLKEKGKVTRGWLGVGIVDIAKDPGLAKSFHYTGDKGVLVEQTFSNTPATGKLQNGDIITEVNGKPADDVLHLRNQVASTKPGEDLKLKVWRDGKYSDVDVKIGEQPEDLTAVGMRNGGRAGPGGSGNDNGQASKSEDKLGLRLMNPSEQLLQQFGLGEEAKEGAVITSVKPNSPAYKAGLRPGMVITRVNNQSVKDAQDATAAIGKQDVSKGVRFYVVTPAGSRFVFVEP